MSETEFTNISLDHDFGADEPAGIMGALADTSIKFRLWSSFALITTLMLIWGAASIGLQLWQPAQEVFPARTLNAKKPPAVKARVLEQFRQSLAAGTRTLGFYLLTSDPQLKNKLQQELANSQHYLQTLQNNDGTTHESLAAAFNHLSSLISQTIALAENESENYPSLDFLENYITPDNRIIERHIDELIKIETSDESSDFATLGKLHELGNSWTRSIAGLYQFIAYRTPESLNEHDTQKQKFLTLLDSLKQADDTLDDAQAVLLGKIDALQENVFTNIKDLSAIQMSDKWRTDAYLVKHKITPALEALETEIGQLPISESPAPATVIPQPAVLGKTALMVLVSAGALILILAAMLTWLLSRNVQSTFAGAARLLDRIASGKLDNRILFNSHTEAGKLLRAVAGLQDTLRNNAENTRRQLRDTDRFQQAMEHVTGNIIIAGKDHRIRYINKAALAMFQTAREDISQQIPDFDPTMLVGMDIGLFHTTPSDHIQKISHLAETLHLQLEIGPRIFDYLASPILDENGKRLGTVIEWVDRTDAINVEKHIYEVVEYAKNGDLSHRLTLACDNEYYAVLEEQLNALLGTNEQIIQDTIRVVGAIANGDLTQNITSAYKGDYLELKNNVNATVTKLTSVIGHIRNSAYQTKINAHGIKQGNIELSIRTEQQSASIEKTAANVERITGIVRSNLNNTQSVNALAAEARDEARNGGVVVNSTIAAMTKISESSKKIADIIHVIDEIAFQTNLLALNASVEAAHAGDLGRGFAVVATEVRNLAQRSATAAKEITALIEDSVTKVDEGSRLVDESGHTLTEIITSISKVSEIISEISSAGEEQASGIEQINKAILEIDQATQQNTSMIEETASASETLNQQADELSRLVSYFNIIEEVSSSEDILHQGDNERRGEDRPWSDNSVVLFDEVAEPEPTAQASHADWQEF